MKEICIDILWTKLKEIRELSDQINNELLLEAVQKLEEVLISEEKTMAADGYLDNASVAEKSE